MRRGVVLLLFLTITALAFLSCSSDNHKQELRKRQYEFLLIFDSVWETATKNNVVSGERQEPPIRFVWASTFECAECNFLAFTDKEGSVNVCPRLLTKNIEAQRYVAAHEIIHLARGHNLIYENATEEDRIVYECEATVGSASIISEEEVVRLLEEDQAARGTRSPIYDFAYRRALDVLRGKRSVCRNQP